MDAETPQNQQAHPELAAYMDDSCPPAVKTGYKATKITRKPRGPYKRRKPADSSPPVSPDTALVEQLGTDLFGGKVVAPAQFAVQLSDTAFNLVGYNPETTACFVVIASSDPFLSLTSISRRPDCSDVILRARPEICDMAGALEIGRASCRERV